MNLEEQKLLRHLGKRIRQLRQDRKWTQAEFGQRCELDRTFIGSVERGERNVSVLNLNRIAKVLRLPLAELLAENR
jgi:transcriptional regulator with XRE-family HTH domain